MELLPIGPDYPHDTASDKSLELDDLWTHRKDGRICKTCMHYTNYRCRRHAPTIDGYPPVYPEDWCGDHKLDKVQMGGI